jgi:hypothetical protein
MFDWFLNDVKKDPYFYGFILLMIYINIYYFIKDKKWIKKQ